MSELSELFPRIKNLVAENYNLTLRGEPILLARHDGQQVFRLDTTVGTTVTLRLSPATRPYKRVQAESQGLLYLHRHSFPAPVLLPTKTGQSLFLWQADSWGYLQSFIEGEQPQWSLSLLREVAQLVGRLHTLADSTDPYPAQIDWLDDLDTAIARAESCADDPQWGHKAQEIATTLRALPSLRGLPTGLTHSDLHEGNLLHTTNGQLWLLDWEGAGMTELIIDVGMVLGWHCLWPQSKDTDGRLSQADADYDEEWCKTFLATYQKLRPLSREEARHLAAAIRLVCSWYTARDIALEIVEPGQSEGLALYHWAIVHSLTPARENQLTRWAIETGPQTGG